MTHLIVPNFKQWLPHGIHALIEYGIILASFSAVLLNLFFNGTKKYLAAICHTSAQSEMT